MKPVCMGEQGADEKPRLLSGGNPQIPKGVGDEPVQRYIAAMPEWKQGVGRLLDELITESIPDVKKAVKWNQPFYGTDGETWLLSFRCFTKYVQIAFHRGSSLEPIPPKASKQEEVRYLDIYEEDGVDESQLASWFTQSAKLPGTKL